MRTLKIVGICIFTSITLLFNILCNSSDRTYNSTEAIDSKFEVIDSYYDYDTNTKIIGQTDEKTNIILNDCKRSVKNFFDEKDLDVSSNLNKLTNTYLFTQSTNSDREIWGYYKDGTYNIYLNISILNDEDFMRFIYIHEVCHYLGFMDDETSMLMEGLADAITEEILGYYYENSYDIPRALCHQLLIADNSLISYKIHSGDFDERIDARLNGIYDYPKPSSTLDFQLSIIEYDNNNDKYHDYVRNCQEIISSYCNTFSLTNEQQNDIELYYVY